MKLCGRCGHWHVDNTLRLTCVKCGAPLSQRGTIQPSGTKLRAEGTYRTTSKTPRQARDDP